MQKTIFPKSIPNGENVIFPQFKGKIIGGQVLMIPQLAISGSPHLLGTFYPEGGFQYVKMVSMSLNHLTYSSTQQLAIFSKSPDYEVDGSFPLELNVTSEKNDSTTFWEIATNPGTQTFLVVITNEF